MSKQQQGDSPMALLLGIWKHTPLGIVIEALMKPSASYRARKPGRSRSNAIAQHTPVARQ
jgi:hypothetical protein